MRILFAATEYIRKGRPTTGFPMYLYRVTQALKKQGHEPLIVSLGTDNGKRFIDGIEVHYVKSCRYCFSDSNISWNINSLTASYDLNEKIKDICNERKIDIIQFTSLEGIARLYFGRVPAVMRLSSYAKTSFASHTTCTEREVRSMALAERFSSRRCNAIFAPCKVSADSFGLDIKRKVSVIESPFVNDVVQYDYSVVDEQLKNKKYVLFFGKLYAEKGILVIAEILQRFLKDNQEYYFVFVGDATKINGKNAAAIIYESAGQCRDRVIVMPALEHDRLYPVIMKSDFVVLPSLMENLSNACIEAMAFSKVVIGTRGASFEQLIDDGVSGFLCEIGNSQNLLDTMNKVVCLPERVKNTIEQNAHARCEMLAPEVVVAKLVRYYEYVIERSK